MGRKGIWKQNRLVGDFGRPTLSGPSPHWVRKPQALPTSSTLENSCVSATHFFN